MGEFPPKAPEQDEDRDIVQPLSTLFPPHAQSEEANSLAGRLPSRMRSVETFRLRVKLLNLQGRIEAKYMEIRWLGEVEPTFNPSFYRSLVRMPSG